MLRCRDIRFSTSLTFSTISSSEFRSIENLVDGYERRRESYHSTSVDLTLINRSVVYANNSSEFLSIHYRNPAKRKMSGKEFAKRYRVNSFVQKYHQKLRSIGKFQFKKHPKNTYSRATFRRSCRPRNYHNRLYRFFEKC